MYNSDLRDIQDQYHPCDMQYTEKEKLQKPLKFNQNCQRLMIIGIFSQHSLSLANLFAIMTSTQSSKQSTNTALLLHNKMHIQPKNTHFAQIP